MTIALVTGGAGFIGSHIATALVGRGDEVCVLDNLSTGHRANLSHLGARCRLVEGDVLSPDDVERAVRGAELVFHQAALASVPRSVDDPLTSHAQCATGVLHVLDAARRAGVRRVVYAASSSCYGNQASAAKRELDPPTPLSPYAAAKLSGEMYCQAFAECYGLETVSLRYFNVFGPRQDPEGEYSAVIPKFVTRMLAGKRPIVFGSGRQSRDFVYVGDVAAVNLLAADAPEASGKVFNVGCGRQVSLLDLIAAINGALGLDLEPEFQPPRSGDVMESQADITRARAILGYEPQVDFAEGLKLSIDHYRSIA